MFNLLAMVNDNELLVGKLIIVKVIITSYLPYLNIGYLPNRQKWVDDI